MHGTSRIPGPLPRAKTIRSGKTSWRPIVQYSAATVAMTFTFAALILALSPSQSDSIPADREGVSLDGVLPDTAVPETTDRLRSAEAQDWLCRFRAYLWISWRAAATVPDR